MNAITIENIYSWFNCSDASVMLKLWRVLRFKDRGYYHKSAFKMRVWDGFVNFFDKDTGRFLTGLLPEVRAALTHWGVPFVEQDKRSSFEFAVQEVGNDWLPGISLRDYQVEYINQSIKHKRGIIYSPTGSGKSFIMVGIIKAVSPSTPTLVLCNQQDIVDQNYEEITKMGFRNVGRILSGCNEPNVITCMTWQSWDKYKKYAKKVKVLLVDEIHLMMSPKIKPIYRQLENCCVRLGLSATPFKHGGSDLKQKYETKGYIGPAFLVKSAIDDGGRPTTKKLQKDKVLSEAEMTFFRFQGKELPQHLIYFDAITEGIAENQEFHQVVANLAKSVKGRTLIIVERIKQGDYLHDLIPNSVWIRGQDNRKTRKAVRDRLKYEEEDLIAIATAHIFTTGINVFIHNLINAAGGKADHTIIQRLGRGLRKATDKTVLKYFDFYFMNNEYLEGHSKQRLKVLEKEGHKIEVRDL